MKKKKSTRPTLLQYLLMLKYAITIVVLAFIMLMLNIPINPKSIVGFVLIGLLGGLTVWAVEYVPKKFNQLGMKVKQKNENWLEENEPVKEPNTSQLVLDESADDDFLDDEEPDIHVFRRMKK